MRAVRQRRGWRKAPAAATVKHGRAEQGGPVIDSDGGAFRCGSLQLRQRVIGSIPAVKRNLHSADVIGDGVKGGRRWRSGIDGKGKAG